MSKRNTREANILTLCLSRIPYQNILRSFTLKNWSLCGQDMYSLLMARGWGVGSNLTRRGASRTSFKKRFQSSDDDRLKAGCYRCIPVASCNNETSRQGATNTQTALITIRSYMEDRSND